MSKVLSNETIETVKATIPFLQENGLALTEHFYRRLFEGNPEVKNFFNTSNQESGAQQRALGGAICAFAQNIETPEALAAAVSRIGNKHASLGVKPEHYPIVGEHLLGSIDDILNPAPPELLKAWGEAYGFLADVLIGAEEELYKEQVSHPGGWSGFRELEVFKKEQESEEITSFYLRPTDGETLPAFRAGQFLTIRVALPASDEPGAATTTMRNYSLSGSPEWDHFRISVKRETSDSDCPDGYVSNYLHNEVSVGSILDIGPPCGDFFLADHRKETPLLLISAGVGLTPILSMFHAIESNPTTFLHIATNGEKHALKEEVASIAEGRDSMEIHIRYTSPCEEDRCAGAFHSEGYLSTKAISEFLTAETEVYFCGPAGMMQSVIESLKELGHPQEKVHYEFFGPE